MGDTEGARETQLEFVGFLNDSADSIPVVGHVKGGIHYVCGDTEGGDKAMKSSSRTAGVIGGGVVGFVVGGPPGAAVGGAAGGLLVDGLTTGIDSAVHEEFRPAGTVAAVNTLVEGKSKSVSGDIFDVVVGTVMDGMTGIAAGEQVGRMSKVKVKGEANNVPANKQVHVDGAMDKVKHLTGDEVRNLKKDGHTHAQAKQKVTGGSSKLTKAQKKQVKQLNRNRTKLTDHNIHGLIEDRQGQIAVDLKPESNTGRGAERIIMEDPKRNYTLNVVEYLDDHKYGVVDPGPGPSCVQRAANFVADHQAVYGAAAGVYPAAAGPKGVAKFDFLVIGASAGGIACANRAAELGKRVAIVGTADKESDVHSDVHYYHGETMFVGPRRLSVGSHLLEAELILLACDTKPDDIGLKWTGVECDSDGYVNVNSDYKTSMPHVYALGGVTGKTMAQEDAAIAGVKLAERLFQG
ncbi:Glutathione amide reductase [Geodia barretti]|uniref:Glutathione amide reductase n=1 Tax=Geodia barretti TaxID=519541 RepID=A0AA35SV33_GEOBA|nr:Glutathione amide reductase [Geodia barretti]